MKSKNEVEKLTRKEIKVPLSPNPILETAASQQPAKERTSSPKTNPQSAVQKPQAPGIKVQIQTVQGWALQEMRGKQVIKKQGEGAGENEQEADGQVRQRQPAVGGTQGASAQGKSY